MTRDYDNSVELQFCASNCLTENMRKYLTYKKNGIGIVSMHQLRPCGLHRYEGLLSSEKI